MARCRRNVDNFLEACRKLGLDEVRDIVFKTKTRSKYLKDGCIFF